MTASTLELTEQLGVKHNTLNRLVYRGILTPIGPGGTGTRYRWDQREQRAAAAVIAFTRSHLVTSMSGRPYMDNALRAIAECARGHDPTDSSVRWIMLLGDGTCLRVSDELAATWPEARTLIALQDIVALDESAP